MKSFCVLNAAITHAAAENIGAATVLVMGRKIAVLYGNGDSARKTAESIAEGVKQAGGCALMFEKAFESQVAFVFEHYEPDCALFISASGGNRTSVSVYSKGGFTVTREQEEKISQLAVCGCSESPDDGTTVGLSLETAYYKKLIENSESFENISAKTECRNVLISSVLNRAISALGGEKRSKPVFCISESGLCMSACDENGTVYTHDKLMAVYAVSLINKGISVELPFSLSSSVSENNVSNKGILKFSFRGGNELWQKDCVFLTAGIMKLMAEQGCGLAQLCSCIADSVTDRRYFESKLSAEDMADLIRCDEVLTDGNNVFARAGKGNLLLTPSAVGGKYCLEIFAPDVETAAELSDLLDIQG